MAYILIYANANKNAYATDKEYLVQSIPIINNSWNYQDSSHHENDVVSMRNKWIISLWKWCLVKEAAVK